MTVQEINPQNSLEELRLALEKSRDHIDRMWVQSSWFTYWVELLDGTTFSEDEATEVPTIEDWVEGWNDGRSSNRLSADDVQIEMRGVCLAGGVLYALDYTSERWISADRVVPVIDALYSHLGEMDTVYYQPGENYQRRLQLLIEWNDADTRSKEQVLELFDKTIKGVIAEMEAT